MSTNPNGKQAIKVDVNTSQYLQSRVIAELILSHLNDVQNTFESTMGSKDKDRLEINMFHAINDLTSSFYQAIEQSDATDVKAFRESLMNAWQKNSQFKPIPYENGEEEHIMDIDVENEMISSSVLEELKKPIYRNRWEHVTILINEIKLYHIYHM